jgi:hypothetical protein
MIKVNLKNSSVVSLREIAGRLLTLTSLMDRAVDAVDAPDLQVAADEKCKAEAELAELLLGLPVECSHLSLSCLPRSLSAERNTG